MRILTVVLFSGAVLFHRLLVCPTAEKHEYPPLQMRHTTTEKFTEFWKAFRDAALKFDSVRLERFCTFPVHYRGPLDDDPVLEVSLQKFPSVFRLFLQQWNGLDTGGSTELELIEKTPQPDTEPVKGRMRIGDMIFLQDRGKWKLTFLYMNNQTIELLKK